MKVAIADVQAGHEGAGSARNAESHPRPAIVRRPKAPAKITKTARPASCASHLSVTSSKCLPWRSSA